MYDYKDKPFSVQRKYGVHPLNQKGFEKYVGYDSHNSNYVSRLNPKVFKEIFGVGYESIIKEKMDQIKDDKEKKRKEEEALTLLKPPTIIEPIEEKKSPLSIPIIPNILSTNEQRSEKEPLHLEMRPSKSMSLIHNSSETPKLSPRDNCCQIFHRKQTFKDKYGYDQRISYKTNGEKYAHQIKTLKIVKFSNSNFNSTHLQGYYPKKRYNGFTSYCVPRIDDISTNRVFSSIFSQIKDKLFRSTSSGDLNKSKHNAALQKQNDEMKDDLESQTDRLFLNKMKLPDVAKLANTEKLIQRIGFKNHKDMAQRYNCSFSNRLDNCHRTKRNFSGSLFLR